MSAQRAILDLLVWVREAGLWPNSFRSKDLFVIPVANRISFYEDLLPHQKEIALWVPSAKTLAKALRARGLQKLELRQLEGFHLAKVGPTRGVGVGQTEALLSLLQHLRRGQLIPC